MAITYASQTGSTISSHALGSITLGDQTQQTGNNTVIVTDLLSVIGNGQIGDGSTGVGDTYAGRLIIIDIGLTTEQRRSCILDTAGTGTTRILTVHEDWDTNPVITTDTIDVAYELADIEDGGQSGGIAYTTRTGIFTFSNDLVIASTGGLQISNGVATELDDDSANVTFIIQSGGYFYSGYEAGGGYINGGEMVCVQNVTSEPTIQFQSGGLGYLYDMLFWAQVVDMHWEHAEGAGAELYGCKLLNNANEAHIYDLKLVECRISGKGATTAIIRANAGTNCNGLILANADTLDTTITTTTETIELEAVLFSSITDYINVRDNKTWNMIDPIWDATIYTDFVWVGTTANEINDKRSVKTTVQTPDGTKLQDAVVIVYEGSQTDNLELVLSTDINGYAEDSFTYLKHATGATTTTYGLHALRIVNYGYTPFVSTQISTNKISGTVTLVTDTALSAASAATALTNGAGITPIRHAAGETDPRPMKVLSYDAGTGTVPSIGETITQGTATGVLVEYIGNAVTGTIILELWNGVEFTDNQTITGTTFSATTNTAAFYEEYTWEIDCNSKSLQAVYDYLAAKMGDKTGSPLILDVIYEQIHEWGNDQQAQIMYSGATGYFTEYAIQAHAGTSPLPGEGVWLSNRGGGEIAYLTGDNGIQFSAQVVTVRVEGVSESAAIKVVANETIGTITKGDIIFEKLADPSGIAEISDFGYEATFDPSGLDVVIRARASGLPAAAIQDDNSVYLDQTTAANSAVSADMVLLPAVPVVNEDGYIFGHPEKFAKLKLLINTIGAGGFTITWQYWNGTWTNLSDVIDDTSSFSAEGLNYVGWTLPGDWTTTTINGQGPYYFIRALYTVGTVTTVPLGTRCALDVTRYLPFVQNRIITSTGLTVNASWQEDLIANF